MKDFKYIQDVEEWLEPMSYDEFWFKLSPYGVDADMRRHCDTSISNGTAPDTVLSVMKDLIGFAIGEQFDLKRRPVTPWVRLVENH